MKKVIFALVTTAVLLSAENSLSAWGELGHEVIAQVAWNHLTPRARKTLMKYLGMPLPMIASDADVFRGVWTMDLGFVPSNPADARLSWLEGFDFSTPENISPWSHCITVDENFKCYPTDRLGGAYIENNAYYADSLARQLKEKASTMDPQERYRAIALITHFLGDMHCPMHIVYREHDCPVKGKIDVTYRGETTTMHKMWDGGIFKDCYPTSNEEMAKLADTKGKGYIRKITKGDVYGWAGSAAKYCFPLHNEFKAGDTVPDSYPLDKEEYLLKELRDGGYRLAKVLDWIFE